MTPSASLEELLWNVSMMARRATEQTRTHVLQRDAMNALVPANQPEETTTSNLVRQLSFQGRKMGVRALLHSRPLEGGLKRDGVVQRAPSGADLELAIEVAPRVWLDFALQAKAFRPSVGTYQQWSPKQNLHLIKWANKYNRIPGMLLYNDFSTPFVKQVKPTLDFTCTAFGACKSVKRVQIERWGQTPYCHGPGGTPAGISMCLDQPLMATHPASVSAIQKYHFQLEHLLHVDEHHGAIDSQGGTLAQLSRSDPPGWASDLLKATETESSDADLADVVDHGQSVDPESEFAARASVVIQFAGMDQ